MTFLHGIEVIQADDGLRPVRQASSSVVAIVGSAPEADAALFPINQPVLLANAPRLAAKLGEGGSLKSAIESIYHQSGARIVAVRTNPDDEHPLPAITGNLSAHTGVYALLKSQAQLGVTPKILCAPGWTHQRPNGVVAVQLTDTGSGYISPPSVTIAAPPSGGTTAKAHAVVANDKSLSSIEVDDPGSGYDSGAPLVTISGSATATASVAAVANPVTGGLLAVAQRIKAIVVADAGSPGATYQEAVQHADDWSSDRLYLVHPGVRLANKQGYDAASAAVTGAIVRRDHERGYWWSPSNQVLNGIDATARAVTFALSDTSAESHLLNEKGIATVIRHDGFRLWGNRTQSSDSIWTFLPVRRTADILHETLERSFLWAVDRPFSSTLIEDIRDTIAAHLRVMRSQGAIINGRVWIDPELNDKQSLQNGQLYVDFDIEPAAPVERLTFRAHRNGDYYEELLADAAAA